MNYDNKAAVRDPGPVLRVFLFSDALIGLSGTFHDGGGRDVSSVFDHLVAQVLLFHPLKYSGRWFKSFFPFSKKL